jgi:septum formation protein
LSNLILASGSPRRREFLKILGIPFTVAVSGCDETLDPGLPPSEAARLVAERKAREVAGRSGSDACVLAADTVVVLGDEVLGKPADREDAARMLRKLSGRAHTVVTGVALCRGGICRSLAVETEVVFRPLTEEQISWYASGDEPLDKAGAYAVQGAAAVFIEAVRGSWTNVVGLPLAETMDLLAEEGFAPWSVGTGGEARRAV